LTRSRPYSLAGVVSPGRCRCRVLALAAAWLAVAALPGRAATPRSFRPAAPAPPLEGLVGAEISDIVWSGRYLWVATDHGLARLDPGRGTGQFSGDWVTFTSANGLARGAISALAAVGDTVWIATFFDSVFVAADGPVRVGNGLTYSLDGGSTWRHVRNQDIFDPSVPGFAGGPFTQAQNEAYGLSIDGQTIWAAFFAGSTVRSRDAGRTWERVLPDGAAQIVFFAAQTAADSLLAVADSLQRLGADLARVRELRAAADSLRSQELLHRTFEVLAYHDTVWVGTAGGICRSVDGGRSWRTSKVRYDLAGNRLPDQPAANWAVALDRQMRADGTAVLWAGTRPTGPGETSSIAFSLDDGATWTATGPTAPWGFAFSPNAVWAATDQGLFASRDQGRTWVQVPVRDPVIGDELRGTFVDAAWVDGILWTGAENGLGRSADEGESWEIISSPVQTLSLDTGRFVGSVGLADSTRTYAAPNPFRPAAGEQTRIHYSLDRDGRVTIAIYDFASRWVRTLVDRAERSGGRSHGENWDGRDSDGRPVANGVYFYRLELHGGRAAFGKVVVLN